MHRPRSILLAGLGNTGSHLAPLIVRMGLSDRLVIADWDTVEAKNMAAAAYRTKDVGQSKCAATKDSLQDLNPILQIESFHGKLEDLPLAYFAGTVVLCLDQNASRQIASERTWWMGGTLVDIAVNGPESLARVTRIRRSNDWACLECGWSTELYSHLSALHACRKIPPTNAPAALGSFAASLAALVMQSPASGEDNIEVVSSPAAGEMFVSKLRRNPECRFRHSAPVIEHFGTIEPTTGLGSLMDRLHMDSLAVPGFSFARRVSCAGCGSEEEVLVLNRAGTTPQGCTLCGGPLEYPAFHARKRLQRSVLSESELALSLAEIGLVNGDVLSAGDNRWIQLSLDQDQPKSQPAHV